MSLPPKDKEKIVQLFDRWRQRSQLTTEQILARIHTSGCDISRTEFDNRFIRLDRSPDITPELTLAVIGAFTARLADHERCTAAEAITLARLTRLPIDQFEKLRDFFRAEEFDQIVGDIINVGPYAPSPTVALIISIKPEVKIRRNQTDRLEEARFGMPLFQGDIISTYTQATATIICHNELVFKLPENNNFNVNCLDTEDDRLVGRLKEILPKSLSLAEAFGLPPAQPTMRTVGSRIQQRQIPLLLSPRNTWVTDSRPAFRWQAVEEARGYLLSVSMPGGQKWERQTSETFLPYPDDAPSLTPGSANIVTLVAFAPVSAGDKTLLRVLDEPHLAQLTEAQAAIHTLAVDEAARTYLLAQLYQKQELWAEAIVQLEHLAAELDRPSAYISQELGNLNLKIGLYTQAKRYYQSALTATEINANPSVQAMAHTGLARVAAAFAELRKARHHLALAEALYRETGESTWADRVATERTKLEQ